MECSGSRQPPTACTQGSRGRGPSQWVAGVQLLLSQAGRSSECQSGQPVSGLEDRPHLAYLLLELQHEKRERTARPYAAA